MMVTGSKPVLGVTEDGEPRNLHLANAFLHDSSDNAKSLVLSNVPGWLDFTKWKPEKVTISSFPRQIFGCFSICCRTLFSVSLIWVINDFNRYFHNKGCWRKGKNIFKCIEFCIISREFAKKLWCSWTHAETFKTKVSDISHPFYLVEPTQFFSRNSLDFLGKS